jgi:hypothetical protein
MVGRQLPPWSFEIAVAGLCLMAGVIMQPAPPPQVTWALFAFAAVYVGVTILQPYFQPSAGVWFGMALLVSAIAFGISTIHEQRKADNTYVYLTTKKRGSLRAPFLFTNGNRFTNVAVEAQGMKNPDGPLTINAPQGQLESYGGFLPDPPQIPPGEYDVHIWSAEGEFLEKLKINPDNYATVIELRRASDGKVLFPH